MQKPYAPSSTIAVRCAKPALDCDALAPGMLLNADLYDNNGVLLVSKGHEVAATLVKRLQGMAEASSAVG